MSKRSNHRPMRCVIVVHPYFLALQNTALLADSAFLSCEICSDDTFFSRHVQGQARDVLQETVERKIQ